MDKNQNTDTITTKSNQGSADCKHATGEINIRLVNDFLFRALLQRNNRVLKGLIASLLHMQMDEIQSVTIENEIVLGEHIPDKSFILDIRVLMNDSSLINLEMQVINQQNWVERSMSYLCRCFDNIPKGEDYIDVKPVVQIGLLDYTLFPESPEFYASYYLMNEKSHQIYSDKLHLCVLDLTHIELATEEDKRYGIDHWARLFKSHTWEELKMLAEKNPIIDEAASTIYSISQDSIMLEKIRAREEAIAHENYMRKQMEEQHKQLHEQAKQLDEKDKQLNVQSKQLNEKDALIAKLLRENEELRGCRQYP